MLNEEKVKNMTKAAAYESGPGKKNLDINFYFRGDYLGLQLIKGGVAYITSYVILVAVWAMTNMEELMLNVTRANYLQGLMKILLIIFAAGLLVYEIALYSYYLITYQHAKKSVKEYQTHLRKIHSFYESESVISEEITEIELTDEETAE